MREKIKSIRPKCPDLIKDSFYRTVNNVYGNLNDIDDKLGDAREKVRELEQEYKKAKAEWDLVSSMFYIEYEHTENSWIEPERVNLLIKNDDDYRNK